MTMDETQPATTTGSLRRELSWLALAVVFLAVEVLSAPVGQPIPWATRQIIGRVPAAVVGLAVPAALQTAEVDKPATLQLAQTKYFRRVARARWHGHKVFCTSLRKILVTVVGQWTAVLQGSLPSRGQAACSRRPLHLHLHLSLPLRLTRQAHQRALRPHKLPPRPLSPLFRR